jgi:hypothetical protein
MQLVAGGLSLVYDIMDGLNGGHVTNVDWFVTAPLVHGGVAYMLGNKDVTSAMKWGGAAGLSEEMMRQYVVPQLTTAPAK